jgi:hypothetical protein
MGCGSGIPDISKRNKGVVDQFPGRAFLAESYRGHLCSINAGRTPTAVFCELVIRDVCLAVGQL